MTAPFGADVPDPEARATAPVKSFRVWCHRCKKMSGTLVGGKFARQECDCPELDRVFIREKMGLPLGAWIPPWGDPLWGRVFSSSAYRPGPVSFGQALAQVVDEIGEAVQAQPPAAAVQEPEPEAATQPDSATETPVPAPSSEVPPEAETDFPDPEDGLGEAAEPGQEEAASGASPEGLE